MHYCSPFPGHYSYPKKDYHYVYKPGDATFPHFEETTIPLSKIKPEGRFKDWTNGTHPLDYICEVILPYVLSIINLTKQI